MSLLFRKSEERNLEMNLEITKGFTQKTCGTCGVIFFVPDELEREYRQQGQSWHCPNGHVRSYTESEADKYTRLYGQAEQCRKNAVDKNRMLEADVQALLNERDRIRAKAKKTAKAKVAK
jgi:hypothetical protein